MDPIIFYIPSPLAEGGIPLVSTYLLSKKPVQGEIIGHRHIEFPDVSLIEYDEDQKGFEECIECKHCYPKAIVSSTDKICVTCRYVKNDREITDETIAKIKSIVDCSTWMGTEDIHGEILEGYHYIFLGEYHENDAKNMGLFIMIKSLIEDSGKYMPFPCGDGHLLGKPEQGMDKALEGAERIINYMFQGCVDKYAYVRSYRNKWCDDVAYLAMANGLNNYVWKITAGILLDKDEEDIKCSRCSKRVPVDRLEKHYMGHVTEAIPELRKSEYLDNITVYTSRSRKDIKHRYRITIYREIP